ncbi:DUF1450 domain-containing protein [Kyrpidia spormannii]|nr:DUF1450 domain-containing protein [Kyrpidia spormannii]
MVVIVEVCDINPAATLDWEELERKYPGTSVILHSCLSQCELCAEYPYAFVDGDILVADSAEQLYKDVLARVEGVWKAWHQAD